MEPFWIENADEIILVQQGTNLEVVRSEKWQDCRDTFVVEKEYFVLHEQGTLLSITNRGTETAKLLPLAGGGQAVRASSSSMRAKTRDRSLRFKVCAAVSSPDSCAAP